MRISPANGTMLGFAVSAQYMYDQNTDHATSDICSDRPRLMHCMQTMWPRNESHDPDHAHYGVV